MTYTLGDNVWIINGMRNRAFAATVVSVEGDAVTAWNEDKKLNQKFINEVAEGEYFKGEPPILVSENNPAAQKLERQFQHRQLGEEVIEAAKEFRNYPTAENLVAMATLVSEWRSYIGIDLT